MCVHVYARMRVHDIKFKGQESFQCLGPHTVDVFRCGHGLVELPSARNSLDPYIHVHVT